LLPILANQSFPNILEDIASSSLIKVSVPSEFLETKTILPIIISHPPTFNELILNTFDQLTTFFKGSSEDVGKIILGAFASAIIALVIKRFSKKHRRATNT
jgi:hypothetical protein